MFFVQNTVFCKVLALASNDYYYVGRIFSYACTKHVFRVSIKYSRNYKNTNF